MRSDIKQFIEKLQEYKSDANVFNPWRDYDKCFDIGPEAPNIRSKQMEQFLNIRMTSPKYLLVAEAIGYQGGKFTGMALTSERMLMGFHKFINSSALLKDLESQRTSNSDNIILKETQRRFGFTEPTATIIWKEILRYKISPYQVITWNIFPFHPYNPKKGRLSNRTPTAVELEVGMHYTEILYEICPDITVISIGRYSNDALNRLGIKNYPVPHPANGNSLKFKSAIKGILDLDGKIKYK